MAHVRSEKGLSKRFPFAIYYEVEDDVVDVYLDLRAIQCGFGSSCGRDIPSRNQILRLAERNGNASNVSSLTMEIKVSTGQADFANEVLKARLGAQRVIVRVNTKVRHLQVVGCVSTLKC